MPSVEAVSAGDKNRYFEIARRFDQDLVMAAGDSTKRAWRIAYGACGLTALALGAVIALAPLKSVEPFVIRVDNATGIVDQVSALTGPRTYDEAVTKYFAAIYVRSREGFVLSEAEQAFRTVSLMSIAAEQRRFQEIFRGSNPQSPQVVYGRAAVARVSVKSISLLAKNVAAVRYLKTVIQGEETKTTHWIATLTFQYAADAMSTGDRMINPLGFVVTDYRADPESVQ